MQSMTVIISWWSFKKPDKSELNKLLSDGFMIKDVKVTSSPSANSSAITFDSVHTTVVYVLEKSKEL